MNSFQKLIEERLQKYKGISIKIYKSVQCSFCHAKRNARNGLGKIVNKVPLLEKGPMDEALMNLGEKLQKSNEQFLVNSLENLRNYKRLNVEGFNKQYQNLAYLYSGQAEIFFDKENLYVSQNCLN